MRSWSYVLGVADQVPAVSMCWVRSSVGIGIVCVGCSIARSTRQPHLLILDQSEVGVAPTTVPFDIGDLVGVAIDRRSELARATAMVDVVVAENDALQSPTSSRKDLRAAVLDAGIEGDWPVRTVDQVNVGSERRSYAHLPYARRYLCDRGWCSWFLGAHTQSLLWADSA